MYKNIIVFYFSSRCNMGVFNEIFNNWIQVVDDKNSLTIENYSYDTGEYEIQNHDNY